MSANLTAEEICGLAFVICQAAAPTPPAFAPETSIEERAQRFIDWFIDSDYEDEYIRIAIRGASSSYQRKKGFKVAQFLALCSRSKWSKHFTNSPFLALLAMDGSKAAYKIISACSNAVS